LQRKDENIEAATDPGDIGQTTRGLRMARASLVDSGSGAIVNLVSKTSDKPARTQDDELRDEINEMSSRFSPYLGLGSVASTRAGEPGFDRLISQETALETSTTFGNQTRLTLIAKPVFLDAGSPTGQSTLRLGTLGKAQDFEAMFINEFIGSMFEGIQTDGPMGGGPAG